MKLYATVTSERAQKSQGGNWIAIQVKDEKRENILTIALDIDGLGQWHIAKVFGPYRAMYELEKKASEGIDQALYEAEKGNKQKGECEVCHVKIADNVEIHSHYIPNIPKQ